MGEPKDERSEPKDAEDARPELPTAAPAFIPGSVTPLGAVVPSDGEPQERDEGSDDYLDTDAIALLPDE